MIKMLTVIGARPQFVKAAAISRAIKNNFRKKIKEVIVHTGQHYDANMSKVFFDELKIPREDYNLEIGSDSHGAQTAGMIAGIEKILLKEKPDCVMLYGDTNSTLAGAIAASKLHIPIIHVEGGVRSFNKFFPEEINRLIGDHLASMVFVPTIDGMKNLKSENVNNTSTKPVNINNKKIYLCGDIMYDNAIYYKSIAQKKSNILSEHKLEKDKYILLTIHRPDNTDDSKVLGEILNTCNQISIKNNLPVFFPVHPRTLAVIKNKVQAEVIKKIKGNSTFIVTEPASYLDMIALEVNAHSIFTDSGGVQKEAYFYHKPCLIMLAETPWVELIDSSCAYLVSNNPALIKESFDRIIKQYGKYNFKKNLYGNGKASEFICNEIYKAFSKKQTQTYFKL